MLPWAFLHSSVNSIVSCPKQLPFGQDNSATRCLMRLITGSVRIPAICCRIIWISYLLQVAHKPVRSPMLWVAYIADAGYELRLGDRTRNAFPRISILL